MKLLIFAFNEVGAAASAHCMKAWHCRRCKSLASRGQKHGILPWYEFPLGKLIGNIPLALAFDRRKLESFGSSVGVCEYYCNE